MLNKPIRNVAFAAVLLMSVVGCEKLTAKHQIVRAGEQTFLLEQTSGEVKLIQGTAIIPIKVVGELATEAKVWPDYNLPNVADIKLSIHTKYRDGKMLYLVEASPFKGTLENAWGGANSSPAFHVDFTDRDRFRVGEVISLLVRDATRIVASKGEIVSLSWTGSQPMSIDAYQEVDHPEVRWSGFEPYIAHSN